MYEESPELVHQLLYRVLQSNLPFHCGKDNDSPHASLHQVPPLHPIGWQNMIPAWNSNRSVPLIPWKLWRHKQELGNFPANLLKILIRQYYREGLTICCKHQLFPELNFCHQSDFFTLLRSVPPQQDPRKIAYILIELAFSMEIFFFFRYIFTNINIYYFQVFLFCKKKSNSTLLCIYIYIYIYIK